MPVSVGTDGSQPHRAVLRFGIGVGDVNRSASRTNAPLSLHELGGAARGDPAKADPARPGLYATSAGDVLCPLSSGAGCVTGECRVR
jgi:hypothetical protein